MSRTLNAPRWGSRTATAGLAALALAALVALALAPQANAAFTVGKCAGTDISGTGASFARDAHGAFKPHFRNFFCAGTVGAGALDVEYVTTSSGTGRAQMMDRTLAPRFGMSDEPPSSDDIAKMNAGFAGAGADPNPNDNSQTHVVPAAVGAVVAAVNFPNNCDVNLLNAESRTPEPANPGFSLGLIRVRFTKSEFESIWAKDPGFTQWDEVFTELAGDADCDKPIIRVVRSDESGTTFTLKDYLSREDPAEGWTTTYTTGTNKTREWPGAVFGARAHCSGTTGPGSEDDAIDQLTSSCSTGNGGLISQLIATDGSVGYSDLATARGAGLTITQRTSAGSAFDNDVFWTQVQNGDDEWTEPTDDPNGFVANSPKGANCLDTDFTGVPGTTLGSWSSASGVDAPDGYGICTLTYGLLFDDYADAYGTSAAEESKAKTVKDYWTDVVFDGQGLLFGSDYAPLPADILAISRAGVAAIDWNKGAGGGDNGGGGGNGGGDDNGGGNNTPTPPAKKPSNQFSVPKTAISSKNGSATLSVKLPGKGKLELVGNAKSGKKTVKVGRVVLTANKAGTFKLTLKPGKAAKALLKSKGSLKVALKLTYTPTGGTAKSSTRTVTLKLTKPKKSGRR